MIIIMVIVVTISIMIIVSIIVTMIIVMHDVIVSRDHHQYHCHHRHHRYCHSHSEMDAQESAEGGGRWRGDFSSVGHRSTTPKQARTYDQFCLRQDTAHSLVEYGKHNT